MKRLNKYVSFIPHFYLFLQELAGFGGDAHFLKQEAECQYNKTLFWDTVRFPLSILFSCLLLLGQLEWTEILHWIHRLLRNDLKILSFFSRTRIKLSLLTTPHTPGCPIVPRWWNNEPSHEEHEGQHNGSVLSRRTIDTSRIQFERSRSSRRWLVLQYFWS